MKDNNQLSDEELQEIKNCLANITHGQWHDVLTIRKNKRTGLQISVSKLKIH